MRWRRVLSDGTEKTLRCAASRLVLGGPDADVVVEGARERCVEISLAADGSARVRDLTGSGVRVNGEWVTQRRLREGDVLEIGRERWVFLGVSGGDGSGRPEGRRQAGPGSARRAERLLDGERTSADHGAQAPRRKGSSARSWLYAVAVLVFVAGAWKWAAPDATGEQTFDTAEGLAARMRTWLEAGAVDRARQVAEEAQRLGFDSDRAVADAVAEVASLEARTEMARRELARLRALAVDDADSALDAIGEALDLYGDLPEVGDALRDLERSVQAEVFERKRPKGAELEALFARVDEALARGDFSGARDLWRAFDVRGLAVDQRVRANDEASIDVRAQWAAERLEASASRRWRSGDALGALVELSDEELARFRGTPAFARLEALAAEIERSLEERGSVAGGKPTRRPESSGRETVGAEGSSVAVREADTVERRIEKADRWFESGRFAESLDVLERALASRPRFFDRERITRRMERAQRALWFVESVVASVEEDPRRVEGLVLHDRTGRPLGALTGVAAGRFVLRGGATADPLEVDPVDLHRLAARFDRRRAEDLLNEACFALSHGDRDLADRRLAVAFEEPSLLSSVHRMVCFLRDMEEVPEWGFFRVEGEWLTFREKERRQRLAELAALEKALREGDDEEHRAALASLEEVAAVLPDEVRALLVGIRRERLDRLEGCKEIEKLEALREKKRLLEERRKEALERIFDVEWYFYPYTPPAVSSDKAALYPERQREVDRLVARVREIWGDEFAEPPGGVRLSHTFRDALARLVREQELLARLDPDSRIEERARPFFLLPVGVERISVRDIALDPDERSRLDRDREILAANASAQSVATPAERQQIWITNCYRRMMGRSALRLNDRLVRAARGHCEWMSRTGKFSHFNDEDPSLRTPSQRIAAQGYRGGGAGENIAIAGGARAAHDAWIHSSGHHRNILFPSHKEVGVGNVGRYWCQNFAGGAEYTGNLVDVGR